MSDINRTILVGRLTKDAVFGTTGGGMAYLNFSIANSKTWKQDGEKKEQVSFFNCVIWGKFAESMSTHLVKGLRVGVEGRLQQETWDDQDGKKRQAVKVVVENLQFLSNSKQGSSEGQPQGEDRPATDNPFSDEDIPF